MLSMAMGILMQRLNFQHIQSSTGSPISGESTGGTGLKLVDVRCGKGDGRFHERGVFWSQRHRFRVLSNDGENELRVRVP